MLQARLPSCLSALGVSLAEVRVEVSCHQDYVAQSRRLSADPTDFVCCPLPELCLLMLRPVHGA